MAIIKLKQAGEEATLAIATAEVEQGQYGEQVKFTTKDGDVMWVPLGSVQRQLDRCKAADIEELAGKTLHFFRAPNSKPGSAPFWNIDLAIVSDVVKSNGKPLVGQAMEHSYGDLPGDPVETGAPPAVVGKPAAFAGLVSRYKECADAAAYVWGNDGSVDLVAAAATLLIQREKAGV